MVARLEVAELQAQTRLGSGSIRTSLFAATDEAHIPDAVASQMADASGVTFRIHADASWLLPGAEEFAAQGVMPGGLERNRDFYGPKVLGVAAGDPVHAVLFDPQTSGGLLLSVPAKRAVALVLALRARKLPAIAVGEVVRRGSRAVEVIAA